MDHLTWLTRLNEAEEAKPLPPAVQAMAAAPGKDDGAEVAGRAAKTFAENASVQVRKRQLEALSRQQLFQTLAELWHRTADRSQGAALTAAREKREWAAGLPEHRQQSFRPETQAAELPYIPSMEDISRFFERDSRRFY